MRLAAVLAAVLLVAASCGDDDESVEASSSVEVTASAAGGTTAPAEGAGSTVEDTTSAPTSTSAADPVASGEGCADVIGAEASPADDGTYTFRVTVSSADTGVDKYADLWEVRGPDGAVLGSRILTHPHVDEQPFTRSQSGIAIPEGTSEVTVAARDTVEGFCGETLTVSL